ncbi:Trk system potassium transporter TrkA [Puniceicoccus vermicola]|uniref:Trk system potassium uptake protein TrkA n=1 Tax=Puniceicoccus vermicola TaxID=388746 RepID=A0A7X1AWU7_9BACT|nr:Trk system potassium transporter TrkA [Puniceicoccus vermicola]MBC2601349.1 Trk system potassium transporter TrkA [Puniceicoccus vermicola]
MKTIIVGAGEVGSFISQNLSRRGHSVTLIEKSAEGAGRVDAEQDVKVMCGNGSSASMLEDAGIASARNFVSLTSDDRTNLVACKVARELGKNLFTVARIHDQTYLDHSRVDYQDLFDVDFFLNPEMLCAVELAKAIRHPGRVAIEHFARGQIEVQNMAVSPRSKLIGQSLREMKINPRMRVGMVTRDGETMVARADSSLAAGDQLTVFGNPEAVSEFRRRVEPGETEGTVRVVLYGGSEIAISLIRLLKHPRFRVRVIEPDSHACEQLASRFPGLTVVHGDATSRRLLEEEQIDSVDYFVACTKEDEHNIMTCLQASKLGAAHVQLVINKPDYEDLLDDLRVSMGVASVVSPRQASVKELVRYLDRESVVELSSMSVRSTRLLEVAVSPESAAVDKKLMDLKLPEGCLLVALLRGVEANVPGAQDKIEKGDRVLLAVDEGSRQEVIRLLTRKG